MAADHQYRELIKHVQSVFQATFERPEDPHKAQKYDWTEIYKEELQHKALNSVRNQKSHSDASSKREEKKNQDQTTLFFDC